MASRVNFGNFSLIDFSSSFLTRLFNSTAQVFVLNCLHVSIFFFTFLSSISLTSHLIYEASTPHIEQTMFSFLYENLFIYTKVSNIFPIFVFAYVATPAVEKQSWIFVYSLILLLCALNQAHPPLQAFNSPFEILVLHILLSHQYQLEHFPHTVQIHFQRLGYLYISFKHVLLVCYKINVLFCHFNLLITSRKICL